MSAEAIQDDNDPFKAWVSKWTRRMDLIVEKMELSFIHAEDPFGYCYSGFLFSEIFYFTRTASDKTYWL